MPNELPSPSESARAFGAGSDARIAGRPPSANPFPREDWLYFQWRKGWRHADAEWGLDARRPVAALPEAR